VHKVFHKWFQQTPAHVRRNVPRPLKKATQELKNRIAGTSDLQKSPQKAFFFFFKLPRGVEALKQLLLHSQAWTSHSWEGFEHHGGKMKPIISYRHQWLIIWKCKPTSFLYSLFFCLHDSVDNQTSLTWEIILWLNWSKQQKVNHILVLQISNKGWEPRIQKDKNWLCRPYLLHDSGEIFQRTKPVFESFKTKRKIRKHIHILLPMIFKSMPHDLAYLEAFLLPFIFI